MRIATSSLLMITVLLCTSLAFADAPTPTDFQDQASVIADKDAAISGVNQPRYHVGGEDIPSAVPIPALPYHDTGNTCDFADDYDEVCPYSGSTSPDVVYSYSPDVDIFVDIDLCASLYDTKVYVYENAWTPGYPIACNDDAGCGITGWQSKLTCVEMFAGNVYYIVVDGYGGDCGDYDMIVSESGLCSVECPPGGLAEGEPDCYAGYVDMYNGGCNSTPNVFTEVACDATGDGPTICGTYGGWYDAGTGYNMRDTDWYEITIPTDVTTQSISICGIGEYETLIGYLDASLGCGAPAFVDYITLGVLEYGCLDVVLPGGTTWWVFAATRYFGESYPCGAAYILELNGYVCPPVAVEQMSWGTVKATYK